MANTEQLSPLQQAHEAIWQLTEKVDRRSNTWVALLPKSNNRLIHWRKNPMNGVIQIETLESYNNFYHTRIYIQPTETHIPTIVIGHPSVVGVFAWRDHKSSHPLRNNISAPLEDTHFMWPADFDSLGVVKSINRDKISYYVRPSSYLLTEIDFIRLVETTVKIKKFTNLFDGSSFAHITAPNEWDEAFPPQGIQGIVSTNSPSYIAAHPEYTFTKIVEPLQNALLFRNQSSNGQLFHSMI